MQICIAIYQLALVALMVTTNATRCATGSSTQDTGFVLNRLFDFVGYKLVYRKTYHSISEEVVRQKLYLARAIRALVSGLAYKYRESAHYLAINHMSDWTPTELIALENQVHDYADDTEPFFEDRSIKTSVPEIDAEQCPHKCKLNPKGLRRFSLSKIIRRLRGKGRNKRSIKSWIKKKLIKSVKNTQEVEAELNVLRESVVDLDPWELKQNQSIIERVINVLSQVKDSSEEESETSTSNLRSYLPGNRTECDSRYLNEIYVDHRGACMNEIQDQGGCGSCYAFSTLPVFEWLICKRTGKLYKFSEQFIIDCGPESEFGSQFEGCIGGKPSTVGKFLAAYGAELLQDYPYVQDYGTCPYGNAMKNPETTGYLRLGDQAAKGYKIRMKFFEHYIKFAPIKISIGMRGDFSEYGGGIHQAKDCCKGIPNATEYCGGHGVLMVGHGREDGEEYWLIRNSYSTDWGEEGYYRMSKKAHHCIHGHYGWLFAFDGRRMFLESYVNYARPPWIQTQISDMTRYERSKSGPSSTGSM